jgi:hypothetical protein
MASGTGQILIVVFQRVVPVVEQVLAVQLDHRKHTDQKNPAKKNLHEAKQKKRKVKE